MARKRGLGTHFPCPSYQGRRFRLSPYRRSQGVSVSRKSSTDVQCGANDGKLGHSRDELTPSLPHSHRSIARSNVRRASPPSRASVVARAYKVNLKDIDGKVTTLEVRVDAGGLRGCKLALTRLLRAHAQVGEDQNILEVALESGIENLPHDCKLVRTP